MKNKDHFLIGILVLCSLIAPPASADKITMIRSMHTDQINHDTAHAFMNTGSIVAGRPSFGAWVDYGLGGEIIRIEFDRLFVVCECIDLIAILQICLSQ